MIKLSPYWCAAVLISARLIANASSEAALTERMLPLVRAFAATNNISADIGAGTNQVKIWRVRFFQDRPGTTANLLLTNRHNYSFYAEGDQWEIVGYKDTSVPTQSSVSDSMMNNDAVVRSLNQKNRLTPAAAYSLARRHFELQGHKEENFHPASFMQAGQAASAPLPFYLAEWHRRDVRMEDKESGIATLPAVRIEISGITSNLVGYSRAFLPIGADFQHEPPGEKERGIFRERLLPEIRQFIRQCHVPFSDEFGATEINECKLQLRTNPPGIWAWVELEARFGFEFKTVRGKESLVMFKDVVHERGSYGGAFRATNQLDTAAADVLAKQFFVRRGHSPEGFHAPVLSRTEHVDHLRQFRGETKGTPVWRMLWRAKKDGSQASSVTPSGVEIQISATTSNVVFYAVSDDTQSSATAGERLK
jgi:hypothetical protein